MDYDNELEHFSLRWNNYNDNMKTGFHDLLRREDFVDVTIAAEGKLIQAHKMVLSICSPYFKNIFKANPCQHPVVFLKDVTHKELAGILQFMYLGEVSVQQEELGRFLKTAEALQIKGLTSEDSDNKVVSTGDENAFHDQKDQAKCNGTQKNKHKVIPNDLPERQDGKRMKISSPNNDMNRITSQLPGVELPDDSVLNNENLDTQTMIKNEPPELDYYDIECDKVSLPEENSGFSDYHVMDNSTDLGDDLNSSGIAGNNSGIGQDPSSIQGNLDVYKPVDGNQGAKMSPVLTKNQGLCPICGRILQHKKNLQTHIVDQHSGIFGCWPCKVCHKVCRTWSALRVHMNRHHMKLGPGTGPLSFLGVTQQMH